MNIDLSKLPEELRKQGRFLLWRLQDSDTRERCKVPLSPAGRAIDPCNPDNWLTLEQAEQATLEPHPKYKDEGNPVGIGLAISAPYFAVDLDKCYDPETNKVDDWAKELIKRFPRTYMEYSPSGRGFHLWYRCSDHAKLPDGLRTEKAEFYARKRYFTCTGRRLGDFAFVTELDANGALTISNDIKALREPRKKTGTEEVDTKTLLSDLMTKVEWPDNSKAVHTLLIRLFMEDPDNRDAVEARFKLSGLYQHTPWKEKWERRQKEELDLAQMRAKEALAHRRKDDLSKYRTALDVITADDVVPEVLEWLWPERIPLKSVTILAGPPGVGKSLLGLELAARGSLGAHHVDSKPNFLGVYKTILLASEDDPATILVPRLKVMGANLKNIIIVRAVNYINDQDEVKGTRLANLEADLLPLEDMVTRDPSIKLLVIDPLSNYMNGKSMYNDQEFRSVLMPVVAMAQRTGVAVVVVIHNSKQVGRTGLEKVAISLGGAGVARIAWTFVQMEDKSVQVLQIKENVGRFEGFSFITESATLQIGDKKTEQARIKYLGGTSADANTVLQTLENTDDRKDRKLFQFFENAIPKGAEVAAEEVLEAGAKLGFSRRAIQEARGPMGLRTRQKVGGWFWSWNDEGRPKKKKGDPNLF